MTLGLVVSANARKAFLRVIFKGIYSDIFLNYLPPALKQMARSYSFLFPLSVIGVLALALYKPGASLNERSYIIFIFLLSFVCTCKMFVYAAKLARRRIPSPAEALPPGGPIRTAAILVWVAGFSLIATIPLFAVNRMGWAVGFCERGAICSLFFGTALLMVPRPAFTDRFSIPRRLIDYFKDFPSIANPSSAAARIVQLITVFK